MERNYSIDFLKILFALSIACGHFKGSVLSSDLIVELFFILSGFFLVNSFYSGKYHGDALSYTASRLKRIYPYYLLAFLILLFLSSLPICFIPSVSSLILLIQFQKSCLYRASACFLAASIIRFGSCPL